MAKVPLVELARQHQAVADEVERAVLAVLRSGHYLGGAEVAGFEREVAESLGVRHAIGCASGTGALMMSLLALDLRSGDEVIVPAFTIFIDAEVVSLLGGVPRFADVDPRTFTLDPERVGPLVGPRTRAILATDLYGQPADYDGLTRAAGAAPILEDACQAFGARYRGRAAGSLGRIGCFSFFPTKNLGAYGDGGLCVTDDDELAARLRRLRNHGARERYVHEELGLNGRLDELQAAALRVKLRHVDGWNRRRRAIAARYDAGLRALGREPPFIAEGRESNYHHYTVRFPDRERVVESLARAGVETAVHYPAPPFAQGPYAAAHRAADYPVATRLSREVLSLPMFAELTDGEVDRVLDALAAL